MRLPFGSAKKTKDEAPPLELEDESTSEADDEADDATQSENVGVKQARAKRTRLQRLILFGRGPKRWTAWRMAAAAILVYVAAANLAYFLVLKPVRSRLDGLKGRKAVIEDLFVARESSAAVAAFRDELMKGDQRMTVITSLENIAKESDVRVTLDAKLLSEVEISKRTTEYPVEMTLKGTYHEIGEFLSRVESSSRFMIVRRVTLEAPESGSGDAEARVVIGAVSWED